MKKVILLVTCMISLNLNATNFNEANWYLTVDVEQIRDRVMPLLPQKDETKKHFKITQLVPDSVGQVTLYGQSKQEKDVTAVFHGQFDQFSIPDYVAQLMVMADEGEVLLVDSQYAYKGRVIEHISTTDKDDDLSLYASTINPQMMVVSFNQQEVKNWIDQRYQDAPLIPGGLVTLLVNVESAMAHMGADLSKDNATFKSAVFQKITQISGSLIDDGNNMIVETAFGTRDEGTARQVEQVINGLVAVNALSNQASKSPAFAAAISQLKVVNKGKDLIITTSIPFALAIEAMAD